MAFLKKIVWIVIIGGILYGLMSYHFIVIDNSVKLLKKTEPTLKYTIFSTRGKNIDRILAVKELWEDGIGDLLVKEGKMSKEQLELYKEKLQEEED